MLRWAQQVQTGNLVGQGLTKSAGSPIAATMPDLPPPKDTLRATVKELHLVMLKTEARKGAARSRT